jgi:hydrogenase nickel incorporation protein HypA/HybF
MHELSLAQGLVEQVIEAAERECAEGVVRIVVQIGKYSGVERDAFEFAFPLAAEDTMVQHAELAIEELPATVRCRSCKTASHPEITHLVCTHCGSTEVELTGGREFLIKAIELEVASG